MTKEELSKTTVVPHQEPSCSYQIPDKSYTTVLLSNGMRLNLTKEKYQRYFVKPFRQSVSQAKDDDDDNKSVTVDTDSDESHSEESKPSKKTKSKKEKKVQNEKKTKSTKNEEKSNDDDESNDERHSKKKKRKSEKDSDVSSSNSNESIQTPKPKKKKKSQKPEKKADSTDEDESDEEIRRINAAAAKIPTYKSVKNLIKDQYCKVMEVFETETSKGNSPNGFKTIRLKLEDSDVENGWCYVHMPRNVLTEMFAMIEKLKSMSQSEKGLFFKFCGMKGLAFTVKFSRKSKTMK